MRAMSRITFRIVACALLSALFVTAPGVAQTSEAETVARSIWIRSFPAEVTVSFSGGPVAALRQDGQWSEYRVQDGALVRLDASAYHPYVFRVAEPERYEVKLEPKSDHLQLMTQTHTGRQPKSVTYSPDGRYMVIAELEGSGLAVYDARTGEHLHQVELGGTGFVESLFLSGRSEVWVSQMIGGRVHVISTESWERVATFWSGGNWSKVLTATSDERLVFLSNWISEDVSVIDAETRTVVRLIECGGVPRGLALSEDERYIYVSNYDNGLIEKHSVDTGALVAALGRSPGAARHLVPDYERDRMYVTDMYRGTVSAYSLVTDELILERYLGDKLNTIALDPSGRFLYLSDRGPNNPVDYTIPGPSFGKATVLDAVTLEPLVWVWGQDQPTGMDVAPRRRIFTFSNFLDNVAETYRFEPDGGVLLLR
jgi:YVTN family beta-propeller protein